MFPSTQRSFGAFMIIILGLIILVAAVVVGVAGVLSNAGSAHALSHFSVLGYHLTGSTGTLFLSGIVVGAAGLLGLSLLLAGARRTSRRGSAARRGLRQSRRETAAASQERDDLIDQRDTARASHASTLTNGTAPPRPPLSQASDRWSRLRDLRHRLAPAQTTARPDSSASHAASDPPAGSPDDDLTAASPADEAAADLPGASNSPDLDVHANASAPAE
jgi:hypothetical protein